MRNRYPGSKGRFSGILVPAIRKIFPKIDCSGYSEPFLGFGGFLADLSLDGLVKGDFSGNDINYAIKSYWDVVVSDPEKLIKRFENYTPILEDCFHFKESLLKGSFGDDYDKVEVAFKKIVIHKISFGGFGEMSFGPMGGSTQKNGNLLDRWNPRLIQKEIYKDHCMAIRRNFACQSIDFRSYIEKRPENELIYLDPPYYKAGKSLYKHSFSESDHFDLSQILQKRKYWLLSYDDCPEILERYPWANIEKFTTVYSNKPKAEQVNEIIIHPFNFNILNSLTYSCSMEEMDLFL